MFRAYDKTKWATEALLEGKIHRKREREGQELRGKMTSRNGTARIVVNV